MTLLAGELSLVVDATLKADYEYVESVDSNGAVVREPGLRYWLGKVRGNQERLFEMAMNHQVVTLQLPDGGKGEVRLSGRGLEGGIEITGSGPAPFWVD